MNEVSIYRQVRGSEPAFIRLYWNTHKISGKIHFVTKPGHSQRHPEASAWGTFGEGCVGDLCTLPGFRTDLVLGHLAAETLLISFTGSKDLVSSSDQFFEKVRNSEAWIIKLKKKIFETNFRHLSLASMPDLLPCLVLSNLRPLVTSRWSSNMCILMDLEGLKMTSSCVKLEVFLRLRTLSRQVLPLLGLVHPLLRLPWCSARSHTECPTPASADDLPPTPKGVPEASHKLTCVCLGPYPGGEVSVLPSVAGPSPCSSRPAQRCRRAGGGGCWPFPHPVTLSALPLEGPQRPGRGLWLVTHACVSSGPYSVYPLGSFLGCTVVLSSVASFCPPALGTTSPCLGRVASSFLRPRAAGSFRSPFYLTFQQGSASPTLKHCIFFF